MVDLKYVFNLRNAEKLLSAVAVVTGSCKYGKIGGFFGLVDDEYDQWLQHL